jgi:dipeptidyl aminopeptidase/acylaminoacyl peptidase
VTRTGRLLTIVYATHQVTEADFAADKGPPVPAPRDQHSRPLQLIYGFVCLDKLTGQPNDGDLQSCREMAIDIYRRFLANEDSFPMQAGTAFSIRPRFVHQAPAPIRPGSAGFGIRAAGLRVMAGAERTPIPFTVALIAIVLGLLWSAWPQQRSPDAQPIMKPIVDGNQEQEHVRLTLPKQEGVSSIAFSPDGKTLATGSQDNTARLWNTQTAKPHNTLKGHTAPITSIAFSPDGKTLATGSQDNTARLWNTQTAKPHNTLKGHTAPITSIAFSPDGKTLATGSQDNTARFWDTQAGHAAILSGYHEGVTSVAFSRDTTIIALAGGKTNVTIAVWKGRLPVTPPNKIAPADIVAFSPDATILATVSSHRTVRLWTVNLPAT